MSREQMERLAARSFQRRRDACPRLLVWAGAAILALGVGFPIMAAESNSIVTTTNAPVAREKEPATSREFYNAGTRRLREGKLREAEAFFALKLWANALRGSHEGTRSLHCNFANHRPGGTVRLPRARMRR